MTHQLPIETTLFHTLAGKQFSYYIKLANGVSIYVLELLKDYKSFKIENNIVTFIE